MGERRVTRTGKDAEGDITQLCNPDSSWVSRSKEEAIGDIERWVHTYHVESGGRRSTVQVVEGPAGKYLRTSADGSDSNNLDNLPDC